MKFPIALEFQFDRGNYASSRQSSLSAHRRVKDKQLISNRWHARQDVHVNELAASALRVIRKCIRVYLGMQPDQFADERDSMSMSILTPAQEAREVIDTETRCHQAEILEPAFLVAMRYLPVPPTLAKCACLVQVLLIGYAHPVALWRHRATSSL